MDNDNNKDNLPYWGRVTATLDWCEENYNVHEYIAEFINTTTNFIFVFLAFYGFYNTWKLGFEKRFLLAYAAISFIGIGSFFFHMTLLYEFQLLDELPSMDGLCIPIQPKPSISSSLIRSHGVNSKLQILLHALFGQGTRDPEPVEMVIVWFLDHIWLGILGLEY
nr:10687_t:CDS:2 [Entrophospora candida]